MKMETFYDKVKAGKHILLIYEYAQVNSQLMPAELIEALAKERQSQNPNACYLSEVNLVSVQCKDPGRNSPGLYQNKEWQKQFDFIQRLSPAEW